MANLNYRASSLKTTGHGGVMGNVAVWDATLPVGGANGIVSNTNDTVTVELIDIPAGSTVNQVSFVNTAYNTGCKIDVGFKYRDSHQDIPAGSTIPSPTAFISAQDVSADSSGLKPIKPIHLGLRAIVTVKFYGATGEQIKKVGSELYLALQGKLDGA